MTKLINLLLLCTLLLVATPAPSVVSQAEKKTAYGVLLDNTASLKKRLPEVKLLGRAFAKRLHQRGPMLLLNFQLNPNSQFFGIFDRLDAHEGRNNERASGVVGIDWTQDEDALNQYLETVAVARGNTDLISAIQSLADEINAKTNAEPGAFEQKVIILITDGEHRTETNGSADDEDYVRKKQQQKLLKSLTDSGINVFAVGLLDDLNASSGRYRLTTRERAESFLKAVTKQTGGRVVFPRIKKLDADQVVTQLLE
jgi:hypothetical protein